MHAHVLSHNYVESLVNNHYIEGSKRINGKILINWGVTKLMKRKVSIFVLTQLVVCMLLMALNMPLVQADAGGTGKFLKVEIDGGGYVIASKVQSGKFWRFDPEDPAMTEKVGAGTIELEAFALPGWQFYEWEGDLDTSENPTDYKAVKYGYVVAVFVELFKITVTAYGYGNIYLDGDIVSGDVFVEYGATPEFTFNPVDGNHISSIAVNGDTTDFYAESYTFPPVTEDQTIDVTFSPERTIVVREGPGGNYFADSLLVVTIGQVSAEGDIIGYSILETVQPGTAIGLYFADWKTTGVKFEGGVELALLIPEGSGIDPYEVRIILGDSRDAILSDVNDDAQVDATDVSIVANAIKFKEYYPWLDINGDNNLTEADILIINENRGATLIDVTGDVVYNPDGSCFVTTIEIVDDATFKWR